MTRHTSSSPLAFTRQAFPALGEVNQPRADSWQSCPERLPTASGIWLPCSDLWKRERLAHKWHALSWPKTWHRHRCRRGLRWLWHQDPNAEPFPALSRKGDMPRSFLVPLGARMPDSSVPPSEWTAPGTAQSRTGSRRATADRVDRADARRLASQEDHRTGLFRHSGAGRAGLHLGTQPGRPRPSTASPPGEASGDAVRVNGC